MSHRIWLTACNVLFAIAVILGTQVHIASAQEVTSPDQNLSASASVGMDAMAPAATASHEEQLVSPSPERFTREWLESHGISASFGYIGDVFSNLRGGSDSRRGGEYLGSADTTLTLDLGKLRLGRGQIAVSGQTLHGRGINDRKVGAVQSASNLDHGAFSKLIEFYYSDVYLSDRVKIKIGRQYADADFDVVENGENFLNSSYGVIPTIPMPTYPAPAFGASVWMTPRSWVSLGVGVFQGDRLDTWSPGAKSISKGVFSLTEAKFQPFSKSSALRGTYRVGIWNQNDGAYLSTAISGAVPVRNHGIYATGDHWFRKPTSAGGNVGPGVFFQLGWSPKDRNEINRYWGGGVAWPGILPQRSHDSIGLGLTRATLSCNARSESVVEFFYKLQATKKVFIQPDLQWVSRPSGVGTNALLGGVRLGFQL